MSILTPEDRRQAVDELLTQYRAYQAATTNEEKQQISNEMFFADPIVWLLYKYEAYHGTPQAVLTWGDLVHHSRGHDGICGKRLTWVERTAQSIGIDISTEAVIGRDTSLIEVVTLPVLVEISTSKLLMDDWRTYEYEQTAGQVTKWRSFK